VRTVAGSHRHVNWALGPDVKKQAPVVDLEDIGAEFADVASRSRPSTPGDRRPLAKRYDPMFRSSSRTMMEARMRRIDISAAQNETTLLPWNRLGLGKHRRKAGCARAFRDCFLQPEIGVNRAFGCASSTRTISVISSRATGNVRHRQFDCDPFRQRQTPSGSLAS